MQGIRNTIAIYFKLVSLVLFFFIPFFFNGDHLIAQQNFYDTDLLPASFHQARRMELRSKMPDNSVAFIFSNPIRNRSNDVNFQYSQDPDLYYLTGLTQPHSVLIIFKEEKSTEHGVTNEILFTQERDAHAELWNGRRLDLEEAKTKLSINTVLLNIDFEKNIPDLSTFESVLVKFPTDINSSAGKIGTLNVMVRNLEDALEQKNVRANSAALLSILAFLREIKHPEELKLLQKAVDMTVEGLSEVIKCIEPGITEYQAQAVVEYYFKHRGAEYPGYPSISGGKENSCVLHYVTNRKQLGDGDLILMDMGAEYHGYTADITRTVPINGKFSTEQKEIYNLVLKAQHAGINAAVAGSSFYAPNNAAVKVITEGLIQLGILKKNESVRTYFSHGTSHYLGLEVHDPGTYTNLKPGMVITVEPGIYIPENSECDKKWWNIGIRIEDDVLITDKEAVIMSEALPREIDEIELLMKQKSLFNDIK